MNSSDYSKLALKTDIKSYDDVTQRLVLRPGLCRMLHASIGMCGETGEIADIVKKSMMYRKAIDKTKLKEECGDALWYMAIMLDEIGSSFEEVMLLNILKLQERFPNGFTEEDAIARVDKSEK